LCDPIRHHHERYDGMGYPDGLPGEEMDLRTHIIVACDAYDAMTCRRPYRPAMSRHRAVEELSACTGTQFHPDVVEALVTILGIEHLAAA